MRVARSARARLIRYTLVGVFMYSFVSITKVQAGLIQRHGNKIISILVLKWFKSKTKVCNYNFPISSLIYL